MLVQIREFKGHRFLAAFLLKQRDGTWQAGPFFTLNKHSFQPFLDCLNGNQEIIVLALNAKSVEELEREVKGDLPKPKPPARPRTARPQVSRNQLELDFGSGEGSSGEAAQQQEA